MTTFPSDSEISSAIETLFTATISCDPIARWNALFPTDTEVPVNLPQGQKHVTYVPTFEAREIIAFIRDIDALLDRVSTSETRTRIVLVGYCHVMESELMPTLIWNQLRLLHGLPPSWRFTRITKKGDIETCWLSTKKYKEIVRLAQPIGQPIGDTVLSIWNADLRNIFSHSRYWLSGQYVLGCKIPPWPD